MPSVNSLVALVFSFAALVAVAWVMIETEQSHQLYSQPPAQVAVN